MTIAYFAHELADAAVHKRVAMLTQAGHTVALLGFERDRGAPLAATPGAHVLGATRNGRFAGRLLAVLGAIPRAMQVKRTWRGAQLIIARNLEMLLLVRLLTALTGSRARIVYECLDIHRLALDRGATGAAVRLLERTCLLGVSTIVTSSPAFQQHYFRDLQHLGERVVLAENKVLSAPSAAPEMRDGPPWVIAWCGVLRCARSFELLRALAERMQGRVRVELWGAPALDQIPNFHERVLAAAHMTYRGRYQPEDLPAIYGEAHFAWAVDFYEAEGNSRWLLPNRLYEALSCGVSPIAVDGVETARWLQRHEVGAVLAAPLDAALPEFFEQLDQSTWRDLQRRVQTLDPEATWYTPEACRAFADRLLGKSA